jgi:hypothetical protein
MKYNQPYGVSDTNAGYVNGNPAAGIQGSIPPAESIEYDQREVVNVIAYAAQNALIDYNNQPCVDPTNTLMDQLLKAIYGMIHKTSGTDDGGVVIKLQADQTIFVNATTGDDTTADGTTGKPFKTLQAANNYGQQRFDLNLKHTLTFKCTGTFTVTGAPATPGVYAAGLYAGQNGAGSVVWDMTAATVNATNGCCFYINQGAQVTIVGGTYSAGTDGVTTNTGVAFQVGGQAIIMHRGGTFQACGVAHFWTNGQCWCVGAYTIAGNAPNHIVVQPASVFTCTNGPYSVSLVGTPGFSSSFVNVYGGNYTPGGIGFSGAATGKKFNISGFGTITTLGAGINYLPGSIAGTISPSTGNGEYA